MCISSVFHWEQSFGWCETQQISHFCHAIFSVNIVTLNPVIALHRWCLCGFVQVLHPCGYNAKPDGSINQCLAGGCCSQNWGECQRSWQHGCSTISTSWLEVYQRWEWSESHLKPAHKQFWPFATTTERTARLKAWIMILLFPLLPAIANFFLMSFQKHGIQNRM